MVALLYFLLALFASVFKSKGRLEAENAALRHQLTVLRRKMRGRVLLFERRSLVPNPIVSMVSVGFEGGHDHPARDPRALAPGRLSALLA
jgi:hypothetical protein